MKSDPPWLIYKKQENLQEYKKIMDVLHKQCVRKLDPHCHQSLNEQLNYV